jgi:peptide-methionine (R)-S-oxide reductase
MQYSEEELKKKLTPEEYHILREGGTEGAFTGEYFDNHDQGVFKCKVCGQELFRHEADRSDLQKMRFAPGTSF